MEKAKIGRGFSNTRQGLKSLGVAIDRHSLIAAATAVALARLLTSEAQAATSNAVWTDGGATNLWSTAGNWSPSAVPNNGTNGFSDYNVSIGTPSPCVLTISPTIDNLTMNTGGVLDIQYNSVLTVNGPNLTDNGSIVINSNQGGALAELAFGANTSITGTGTITLQQPSSNAQLSAASGITVTQAAAHTIAGYGQVNMGFTNNGAVNANVNGQTLALGSFNMSNNLTFEATNGGTLSLNGITVTQGASGQITAANGSSVTLSGATVTGGILSSAGTGFIQVSGTDTVASLTNNSLIDIPYNQALNVTGNLVDNGSIVVNSNTGGAVAALSFNGGTVSGTGTIFLEQPSANAQIDGSLTQAAGHTISGYGEINATLTNNGTVSANVSGAALYIESPSVRNAGLMLAPAGTLYFDSQVAVNNSGGTINADGGSVVLANGASITGGTLTATNVSTFSLANFNSTAGYSANLNNVTIATGTELDVPFNNILSITGSTLTDSGLIVINSNLGGAIAEMLFRSNTLLTGTGTIRMQQAGAYALLATGTGDTITQDIHHSITGYGEIAASLINNNIVNANMVSATLFLDTSNKTNNLTFEATNGGILAINGITVSQGASGQIIASAGSVVTLGGSATVSAGTLSSSGAGYFQIVGTDTLAGVTSNATIDIPYNSQLNVTGNLVDNGSIVVNSNTGGAVAALNFSGGTASGTGSIVLEQGANNAQLNGSLTQASGHTISGYGQINALLTNNGIVNSNVTGQTLTIAAAMTNNNLVEVTTSAATLSIAAVTVTQSAAGQIAASNGSGVSLNSSTIIGGSITGVGTFTAYGTTTLTNVTSSTTVDIPYNNTLNISGNLVDNGSIVVNSNAGGAVAELNFSGGTISGSGVIFLQQPGANAQIDGSFTQAAGHTIAGYGEINGTFHNSGTVNANTSSQSLYVLGTTTNSGIFQASNGGILNIGSGLLTNLSGTTLTGGTYETDASSTISLPGLIVTNAAIVILSGVNPSFTAVTPLAVNSGTFTLKSGAVFSTAGNLSNSGTINVAAPPTASTLTVNGNFNQTAGATNDSGMMVVSGSTNISGGVVTVGFGGSFSGTPITVGTGAQLLASGTLLSNPAITDNGSVIFGANPNAGILTRSLASLAIGSGGSASVAISATSGNRSLLITSALSIAGTTNAWTGKLDLGNNDLDVAGGSLANISNQIKQGYNNGNFNGTGGIISSAAASNVTHLTTLGVIQNNQNGSALYTASNKFDGTTPGASDILAKYTYYGDTNLDGKVDATDYSRIDNGYLARATGWYNGDFNYDGVINGSDYTLIDNAFNRQGAQFTAEIASPNASIASQVAGTSAVPEPVGLGVLTINAIALLGRRRQKHRRIGTSKAVR